LGITSLLATNRYFAEAYRSQFNTEFTAPSREEGSALTSFAGNNLEDILCEQFERTAGNDNCVRFEGLSLQILKDQYRCHYVKARVRVHRYLNNTLAIFHGPRKLASYTAKGELINNRFKQAA